jgi:RNA polymerase sigma factor (sigma-70 family)
VNDKRLKLSARFPGGKLLHLIYFLQTRCTPCHHLYTLVFLYLFGQRIESLPLIQKTILQLFHREEMSLEEISTITALPVNTVKSHLFRARKTLKKEMVKQLNQ